MKIRMGFVSNSSTSSFCIYGAIVDRDDIVALKERLDKIDEDEEDDYEYMESRAFHLGLEYHTGGDGDDREFIGISWPSIGEDETGAQFKTRVEGLVALFCGKPMECETHEEAYYS